MNLEEFCKYIGAEKEFKLAVKFAGLALPIWDKYCINNHLEYVNSISGLKHIVDKYLLKETLDECTAYFSDSEKNIKLLQLYTKFDDPVIALQDWDWELPDEVEKIFYSVYNIAKGLLSKKENDYDELTFYVSINQAIDAIETAGILTENQIRNILNEFKNPI